MRRQVGQRVSATLIGAVLTLGLSIGLVGCGSGEETDQATDAVEQVTGDNDVELKGDSDLDAVGYALVSVQGEKYSDYEIDGDTVRLIVKEGAELSGSECAIISASTGADHPDISFVLVVDGEETAC